MNTFDVTDPVYVKLMELAIAFNTECNPLGIPDNFRLMGFTKADDRFHEGYKAGMEQARQNVLGKLGLL